MEGHLACNAECSAVQDRVSASSTKPNTLLSDKTLSDQTQTDQAPDPIDEICKGLTWHQSFPMKEGYIVKDLAKLNDITAYGVPEDKELGAWAREVGRLVLISKCHQPLLLEGGTGLWGRADTEGYSKLNKLGLQLQTALDICTMDNGVTLLESGFDINHELEDIHSRLTRKFNPERGESQYGLSFRLDDRDENDHCLHDLIDHITAVLLHLLQNSIEGDFWLHNCIRTLAMISAKMKILCYDLTEGATISLRGAARYQKQMERQKSRFNPASFVRRDIDEESQPSSSMSTAGTPYYLIVGGFNTCIVTLLSFAVSGLCGGKPSPFSVDAFETSTLIYDDDGAHERSTCLFSERDGSIGGTADPLTLEHASACFKMTLKTWDRIAENSEGTARDPQNGIPHTLLYWKKTPMELETHERQAIKTGKYILVLQMKQVVSLLVPYNLSCGVGPSILRRFCNLALTMADPNDALKATPQERLLLAVLIRTSAYETAYSKLEKGPDTCTVAASTIAHSRCFTDGPMASPGYDPARKAGSVYQRRIESRREVKETMDKLKTWIIDEKTITIPHRKYSGIVMAVCAALVAGGLTIGLSVNTRIRGVDPSNITMFSWAVAGVIAILMKSLRVEIWPWRDFLRGRVACRSITEVCSVSGLRPQVLLSVLLRLEHKMLLGKSGPFRTPFMRQCDDGFSIDVAPKTSTLINGGVIPIKVQSDYGPALVFLRVPPWGPPESIEGHDSSTEKEDLVCRNLQEPWESARDRLPQYGLCTDKLYWYRILGIYEKEALFY